MTAEGEPKVTRNWMDWPFRETLGWTAKPGVGALETEVAWVGVAVSSPSYTEAGVVFKVGVLLDVVVTDGV